MFETVVSGIYNRCIIGHFLDGSDRYMQVDVYTRDILLVTFEILVINIYNRYIYWSLFEMVVIDI